MSEAVERSNALYAALEAYWYSNSAIDKQTLMEEVENHLDDIIKRSDALKLDLTTLSKDLACYLNEEYFSQHRGLFNQPTEYSCGAVGLIQKWPKYQQAMDLLTEAIMEVSRVGKANSNPYPF